MATVKATKSKEKKEQFVASIRQREVINLYKILIEGNLPRKHYWAIDALIVCRWSVSGLVRIKGTAWKELKKEYPERFIY